MITSADRAVTLPVPCDCGYEFQETIGRLEHNPTLTCPQCGTLIRVDFDDLKAKFDELDKMIDRFKF